MKWQGDGFHRQAETLGNQLPRLSMTLKKSGVIAQKKDSGQMGPFFKGQKETLGICKALRVPNPEPEKDYLRWLAVLGGSASKARKRDTCPTDEFHML